MSLCHISYDNGVMVIKMYSYKMDWLSMSYRQTLYDNVYINVQGGVLFFEGRHRLVRRYDYLWNDCRKEFNLDMVNRIECLPSDYAQKRTFWFRLPYLFMRSGAYLLKEPGEDRSIMTTNFRIEENLQ